MNINTPQLPENKGTGGSFLFISILALAVTGGILYWQYRKGDETKG